MKGNHTNDMRTLRDFLEQCNGPQLGALGEYVFAAKMTELGHKVDRVNANGGDFLVDGVLMDVKTSRESSLYSPCVDKDDRATNIAMTLNEQGAKIKLEDRVVTVEWAELEKLYEAKTKRTGTRRGRKNTKITAAQEMIVNRLKKKYPSIKFVRRAWDCTQRTMCGNGWAPEAFCIKPDEAYQAAILIFFRDRSTRFQFILAYKRTQIKDIAFGPENCPTGKDMTFDLSKLAPHFRFATFKTALASVLGQ